MDKQYVTHIMLQPYHGSATYSEQETIAACHLSPGALHHLHELGLIRGAGIGGQRRYSEEELAQLRQIRRLQRDLGVNLAGVEVILHLLEHLDAVERELEQERRKHEH